MNCEQAREEMLIGEAAELRAGASTPLGVHLAECAKCASAAAAIRDGTDALSVAIGARRRSRRGRRVAVIAALPIAAALVLAVTLRRTGRDPAPSIDPQVSSRHVSVDIAPGQQAAVIKTADPNVTVIWLSPGVGQ